MKNLLAYKYQQITAPMGALQSSPKKHLIDLSLGDPDITTPASIIQVSHQRALAGHTSYTAPAGTCDLRKAIANHYNQRYDRAFKEDHVFCSVGACHGLYLVFQGLINPGDEVILLEPYFPVYRTQIQQCGGVVVSIPFEHCQDLDFISQKISAQTKALVVNSPNNPTGLVYPLSFLKGLYDLALAHDFVIVSDEVYDQLCYDSSFPSFHQLDLEPSHLISVGSFSKNYAMTGWRLGFVLAPTLLIDLLVSLNENICYSAPSISQSAALEALNHPQIPFQLMSVFQERTLFFYEGLKGLAWCKPLRPQSAFYIFADISATGLSGQDFCEKLYEETSILAIPGIYFGESCGDFVRFACTVDTSLLKEATHRLSQLNFLPQ